jgi:hypothetical protein
VGSPDATPSPYCPGSFAYVDFRTEAEQTAVIAKSEQHLDGRRLLIKDGKYARTDTAFLPRTFPIEQSY